MRKILINKKGVALATTALVLVVIALLTSCLLMIATYAMRHSVKMSCRQQAYFTARSAALEFKDYLVRTGITSNLINNWRTTGKVALESAPDVVDTTIGTFDIQLQKLNGDNWRIVATGHYGIGDYIAEDNQAIVYVVADELHSASPKNRNMVLAGAISDTDGGAAKAAPQHFTSTTFYSLEQFCKDNYGRNYRIGSPWEYTIPHSEYLAYKNSFTVAEQGGLEDSMTHLYSKGGTDVDLQASYYSGYLISNDDLSVVGVGATCYGIRTLGNFTMKGAGSNFRVYGDVYVGGDIYMDGASTSAIYGDVYVGGACHIENTYVYGNVYCCGYNEKEAGTWNLTGNVIGGDLNMNPVNQFGHDPGSLRINEAQVERFLRDRNNQNVRESAEAQEGIWCAKYLQPSGQNNSVWPSFSSYNYQNGNVIGDYKYLHIRDINGDEMKAYRSTLDQKLHDDVLGTGSEVTVNDKSEYVNGSLATTPAKMEYDAATKTIMVTESGYIESNREGNGFGGYKPVNQCAQYTTGNFVNCPTTNGNLHNLFANYSTGTSGVRGVLVIDASEKDIDIYIPDNQHIEMQNSDFANQSFSSIAVYGDYAVRVILGNGVKFELNYNQWGVYKINDLTTKAPVFPKMRKDDPNYITPDTIDEPRFYLLSYANDVIVDSEDSNFVGYVMMPNKNTNSKVSFQVSQNNRKFYGCVYADNFVFYNSGQINAETYFCFVPPSDEVFNANLKSTGWITINSMQGFVSSDSSLDDLSSQSFLASPMYRSGVKVTRDKVGTKNSEEFGNTRFFAFG